MTELTRRQLLELALAGTAGILIGCDADGNLGTPPIDLVEPFPDPLDTATSLVTWIQVATDNTTYIAMQKAEMGQGIHTALPLLIAEELDLAVDQIQVLTVA